MAHDLKALSRTWFSEVWNKGKGSVIDELMSQNAVLHGLGEGGRDLVGREQFREFHKHFRATFPDIFVTVEDIILEGDQAVIRFNFTATHQGAGLGIAATRQRVKATGISIGRWKDGQIIEGWNEFDSAGIQAQLLAPQLKLKI